MLHLEDKIIKARLLKGRFGLEQESLRITNDGYFAKTKHPFEDPHLERDFSENQVEINTEPTDCVEKAMSDLRYYRRKIIRKLADLPEPEYLWPFSNPPYIRNEEDIEIAKFEGAEKERTEYREYLSERYGRYKMTFSGIHVNYSFDEDLLHREFELRLKEQGEKYSEEGYRLFKDRFYLDLAEGAVEYGWLLVALTSASPLMDISFVKKHTTDEDLFFGLSSVRTSELGYWNAFTPIFNYDNVPAYTASIQRYIDDGVLRQPSELYYPIRIKPAGKNSLKALNEHGIDHIELRMYDLNPLVVDGLEKKDVLFAQLLLIWLASKERNPLTPSHQIFAAQNIKNAARYDLKTVKIVHSDNHVEHVISAGKRVIRKMTEFYHDWPDWISDILRFQMEKLNDPENRYATQVFNKYSDGYVKKGLQLVRERQEEILQEELYSKR